MAAQHSRYGDYSTRYRFNGKEQDEATGFYYYGARYYAPSLSRWLNVDPLAEKYQGFSSYNYTLNNPVMFVDPDGRSVDDIVFFNRNGEEVNRIESNTIFETYVMNKNADSHVMDGTHYLNKVGWDKVKMPNIIQNRTQTNEDVTFPKYQENDYQIAASTYLTNQELNSESIVGDRGGNIVPQEALLKVPDISPTMVKAWAMQESHSGVTGSILQVNNKGDYTKDKLSIGITKGSTLSAHQNINLAIRYLIGKGFTSTVKYSNSGKTINRNYSWNGWNTALKFYNETGVKGYSNYINTMIKESKQGASENY